MEVNFIQCSCGKPVGHLYLPYRTLRDSDQLDKFVLSKVFLEIEEALPERFNEVYLRFASALGSELNLKAAFGAIGKGDVDYLHIFQEIKAAEVFKELKIRRICCMRRLESPAIFLQQAPYPPKWSNVKIAPEKGVTRIVKIRDHTKELLPGV